LLDLTTEPWAHKWKSGTYINIQPGSGIARAFSSGMALPLHDITIPLIPRFVGFAAPPIIMHAPGEHRVPRVVGREILFLVRNVLK
jgi:hypothetical protein